MAVHVEQSEIHRVSIEEYHEMIERGGLRETTRVELIEGWVVDMSPRTPQHERAVRWLTRWIYARLDQSAYEVMVSGSLTLDRSEPEPDVAVIELQPAVLAHPSSAPFVIEVALSSRDRDLRSKPSLYAPYVEEYWVVDLERACLIVHRSASDGAYRDVQLQPRGTAIAPVSVALGELDTDALFGAAFAERR